MMTMDKSLLELAALADALAQEESAKSTGSILSRLVEKALAHQAAIKARSLKGAAGQKAAANERLRRYIKIARQLIAQRSKPFSSYRELAKAVANNRDVLEPWETVRKHLANAGLLD